MSGRDYQRVRSQSQAADSQPAGPTASTNSSKDSDGFTRRENRQLVAGSKVPVPILDPWKPIGYSKPGEQLSSSMQQCVAVLNHHFAGSSVYAKLADQIRQERPGKPLLGKPLASEGNQKKLWDKECELFGHAGGRILLLLVYALRETGTSLEALPANIVIRQQLVVYVTSLLRHYQLQPPPSLAAIVCGRIAIRMWLDIADFEASLRDIAMPVAPAINTGAVSSGVTLHESLDTEIDRLPERIWVTEPVLRKWREQFQETQPLPSVLQERVRLTEVVTSWVARRVPEEARPLGLITEDQIRTLPDDPEGWSLFYAMVLQHLLSYSPICADSQLWLSGYPGAAQYVSLIEDIFLPANRLRLSDFVETDVTSMKFAFLRVTYRYIWHHLLHTLPAFALDTLLQQLSKKDADFKQKPQYLPDLLAEIRTWAASVTHRCSDANMASLGVHFKVPSVHPTFREGIIAFSSLIHQPLVDSIAPREKRYDGVTDKLLEGWCKEGIARRAGKRPAPAGNASQESSKKKAKTGSVNDSSTAKSAGNAVSQPKIGKTKTWKQQGKQSKPASDSTETKDSVVKATGMRSTVSEVLL